MPLGALQGACCPNWIVMLAGKLTSLTSMLKNTAKWPLSNIEPAHFLGVGNPVPTFINKALPHRTTATGHHSHEDSMPYYGRLLVYRGHVLSCYGATDATSKHCEGDRRPETGDRRPESSEKISASRHKDRSRPLSTRSGRKACLLGQGDSPTGETLGAKSRQGERAHASG